MSRAHLMPPRRPTPLANPPRATTYTVATPQCMQASEMSSNPLKQPSRLVWRTSLYSPNRSNCEPFNRRAGNAASPVRATTPQPTRLEHLPQQTRSLRVMPVGRGHTTDGDEFGGGLLALQMAHDVIQELRLRALAQRRPYARHGRGRPASTKSVKRNKAADTSSGSFALKSGGLSTAPLDLGESDPSAQKPSSIPKAEQMPVAPDATQPSLTDQLSAHESVRVWASCVVVS